MRLFTPLFLPPVLKYRFSHIAIGYLNIIIGFSHIAHNSTLPLHILCSYLIARYLCSRAQSAKCACDDMVSCIQCSYGRPAVIIIKKLRARAKMSHVQYQGASWVYTKNSIPFLGLTCIRKAEGSKHRI